MKRITVFPLITALFVSGYKAQAAAPEFDFHLVSNGQPVAWTVGVPLGSYRQAPVFRAGLNAGPYSFLNSYPFSVGGGTLTPHCPEISVDGQKVTVDVTEVDKSLRRSMGIAWQGGKLYVAENRSLDGSDNKVAVIDADGQIHRWIPTVDRPRAIAVTKNLLFVSGDKELAALSLADGKERWRVPIGNGVGIQQLAATDDLLFVGDKSLPNVRVFSTANGKERDPLLPADALKMNDTLSAVGVALTPNGTLIVSDAFKIREYDLAGKEIRTVAAINNGWALAVSPKGMIALAVPVAADNDYSYTPEVWVLSPDGKPALRLVRPYMRGPAAIDGKQPDDPYRVRTFGGLLGGLRVPGGVAFDDAGNLLVSDALEWPQNLKQFFASADTWDPGRDGGIIRVSPAGEFTARLGSRYSDGKLIKEHLAARIARPPLARTREAVGRHALGFLAWGDSITQVGGEWNGGATKEANNYAHLLARLLEANYAGLQVKETVDGIGGQSISESLCRSPLERLGNIDPGADLIIIELGTNDQVFHLSTPEQYATGLRAMLTSLMTATDLDIVLLSPGPVPDRKVKDPPEAYLQAMEQVGKEFNVPVIDMSAIMKRALAGGRPFSDFHVGPTNCHPNDAGHAVWANGILTELAALIGKVGE